MVKIVVCGGCYIFVVVVKIIENGDGIDSEVEVEKDIFVFFIFLIKSF